MNNLENYGVHELNTSEAMNFEGGVKWWMYLLSPGGAYIMDKFEDGFEKGCECELPF
ncbi:hypothetical protein [Ascidiimonas aurantiaca]|uniref:hypothetical protein n=1 Tax=Ascidiimonas aurantiaca TaxID=1685432 RepID=UPI0030EF8EA1